MKKSFIVLSLLVFEHLDTDHKGYVTFDDFMNLIGNSSVRRKQSFDHLCNTAIDEHRSISKLYFEDFVMLLDNSNEDSASITDMLGFTLTPSCTSKCYR